LEISDTKLLRLAFFLVMMWVIGTSLGISSALAAPKS